MDVAARKYPAGIRALGSHPQLRRRFGGRVYRRDVIPEPNPVAQLVHYSLPVVNPVDGNGDPAVAAALRFSIGQ